MMPTPFDLTTWMFAATAFGVLLIVAAFAIERIQRIRARSTRGVWAVALGGVVMWPGVAALWLTRPAVEAADAVGAPSMGAMTPVSTPVSLSLRQQLLEWWSSHGNMVLLALWLGMSALLFSQLLHALRQLRRAAADAHTTELLGEPVLVSESLGPAVFGVWRPRVVVPRWVLELDESLQQLVVRHEREHCDGRDSWLVWLAVLSTTLVPWNLAVWYLAHRLRLAMEVDCDARTLRAFPERRTAYARLLLFIAQRATPVRIAPALAHWPSHLSRRIAAMTNVSFARPALQRVVATVVIISATVAACSRPIAGNLAGPAPAPKAPRGDATSALPYFDFQVEKPATMQSGAVGPKYPAAQRAAGVKGVVLVQYVVGTDGRVDMTTFKVLKSDHDDFTAAVRDALVAISYEPAMVGGRAVKQLVQQPFVFDLAGSSAPAPAVPAAPETDENRRARMNVEAGMPLVPEALRNSATDYTADVMVVISADGTADMSSF
jgi:TonB family protein